VLAIASLGCAMAFIDATVVNIAFPNIEQSFKGTSLSTLSWVLNAYNIVFAAFPAPCRQARGPARPQANLHHRVELFHVRFAALRDRPVAGAADRVPSDPGAGCRVPGAGRAVARAETRSRPTGVRRALRCSPRWVRRRPASGRRSAAC